MSDDLFRFQPFTPEPISFVDKDGEWLASFPLDIPENDLLAYYETMVRARLLDERISRLQRQGRISFTAQSSGHEGVQVAMMAALRPGEDWFFPYYRDLAALIALGVPMSEVIGQQFGNQADPNKGRQMPNHPGSGPLRAVTGASVIASQVPPAVGTALASKLKGTSEVTVVTFGDGATSEGDWHAGLNFGSVQKAPVLFVCENNRYAISVPFESQTNSASIAEKGHAYGIPGYHIDGMDFFVSYYLFTELVARARNGEGAVIVDARVYRYGGHSSSDDDTRYRSEDEAEYWAQRDPLIRYRLLLEKRGLWNDEQETALRERLQAEIGAAVTEVESAEAVPTEWMFDDVFATNPPSLEQQREEWRRGD